MKKKTWKKPQLNSTEISLEVTAYLPAELSSRK